MISSDPAQAADNWYAYCDNNPLDSVDSNGLQAEHRSNKKNWDKHTKVDAGVKNNAGKGKGGYTNKRPKYPTQPEKPKDPPPSNDTSPPDPGKPSPWQEFWDKFNQAMARYGRASLGGYEGNDPSAPEVTFPILGVVAAGTAVGGIIVITIPGDILAGAGVIIGQKLLQELP